MDLRLSAEDVAEIRRLCEAITGTLGDRYDPVRMQLILQDTPPL